jgi:hypothetical protein
MVRVPAYYIAGPRRATKLRATTIADTSHCLGIACPLRCNNKAEGVMLREKYEGHLLLELTTMSSVTRQRHTRLAMNTEPDLA